MDINPWLVESVQVFSRLKCPECVFIAKKENIFRDHALGKHPMSFVLFGKTSVDTGYLFSEDTFYYCQAQKVCNEILPGNLQVEFCCFFEVNIKNIFSLNK